MVAQTQEVMQAALQLPDDDRFEIVRRLIDSLPPQFELEVDDDWVVELERRAAEIDSGTATTISWDELKLLDGASPIRE